MPKHALSFIELHNQFFMQGSNLGNKINAAQRGAKLLLDDERGVVWVRFKGKASFIPLASVASADAIEVPADIKECFGMTSDGVPAPQDMGPPAMRRRGRPPMSDQAPVPAPAFDPNDHESAQRHREMVRAASANAHKAQPQVINEYLIQEARNAAMGLKQAPGTKAQVQTAHQVGESASITGKKKVMSHAELAKQVAAEAKE